MIKRCFFTYDPLPRYQVWPIFLLPLPDIEGEPKSKTCINLVFIITGGFLGSFVSFLNKSGTGNVVCSQIPFYPRGDWYIYLNIYLIPIEKILLQLLTNIFSKIVFSAWYNCQKKIIPILKLIATITRLIWNYVGAIRESSLLLHDFL